VATRTASDHATNRLPQESSTRRPEPLALRILEWGTFLAALAVGAIGVVGRGFSGNALLELALWVPAVVVADLLPIRIWGSVQLTVSMPVVLAAGMVFSPFEAFLLGLIGTTDPREPRRQVTLARALFNRSNVALSVFAASTVFHQIGSDASEWPRVGLGMIPMLVVDTTLNSGLLLLGAHLLVRGSLGNLVSNVYGHHRAGQFVLGYVCLGCTALFLATVYSVAGGWGIIAFGIPVALARLMFSENAEVVEATQVVHGQRQAIASLTSQMANERRDERLVVAAGLHDEVLGPIYKVHLMGHVIKQDLRSGQLLQLENDVPALLEAAEAANDAIRALIRDLRKSPLGPNGLSGTLRMLSRQIADDSRLRVQADIDDVNASSIIQLLVFEVAREAMNNSVRHSGARTLSVSLNQDSDGVIRLMVEDDGRGFDPLLVDTQTHFGLQLVRERVELAGGAFVVESMLGRGTRLVARFPGEPAELKGTIRPQAMPGA
jgi:signal transduction histidine kinase